MQEHLDANPQAMRVRRETAEHPFGTLKMRMGATHARVPVGDSATLVRDRRLGVRRVSRILLNAADEIERGEFLRHVLQHLDVGRDTRGQGARREGS